MDGLGATVQIATARRGQRRVPHLGQGSSPCAHRLERSGGASWVETPHQVCTPPSAQSIQPASTGCRLPGVPLLCATDLRGQTPSETQEHARDRCNWLGPGTLDASRCPTYREGTSGALVRGTHTRCTQEAAPRTQVRPPTPRQQPTKL